MQRVRGFTLVEIVLAVAILILMMMLAIPSWNGLVADRKMRRTLDDLGNIVREARERSMTEHRNYLVVFGKKIEVRPEFPGKDEEKDDSRDYELSKLGTLKITFPAALRRNPPNEWAFWPTGTCEPAIVEFTGYNGKWTAKYSGLGTEPRLTKYVAK